MEREAKIGRTGVQEPTSKSKEDKFRNTIVFFERAIAEGAHFRVPEGIAKNRWEEYVNATAVYVLNPDEPLDHVGKIYGKTRAWAGQTKDATLRILWENSSPDTQTLFPFEELMLKKPRTQKSKERSSNAHGGRSVRVNRAVKAGKSIREMKQEGLSIKEIGQSRYVLRTWGTDVPYLQTPHSQNLELENNLKEAETDEEKQRFLNQVKFRFLLQDRKSRNPLLLPIEDTLEEAVLNKGWQGRNLVMFYMALKSVGFPMGEIPEVTFNSQRGEKIVKTYHFCLARDKERAIKILQEDQSLQSFRRP